MNTKRDRSTPQSRERKRKREAGECLLCAEPRAWDKPYCKQHYAEKYYPKHHTIQLQGVFPPLIGLLERLSACTTREEAEAEITAAYKRIQFQKSVLTAAADGATITE